MASSSNPPCAACKFLRRKCQPECVFAPYFSPDQPHKFASVHKVFGASNVAKLLNELQPQQCEDAVNSLAYEAEMRLRDPVYGCVGVISLLQHQLHQLQMDLGYAKSELSRYRNLGIIGHGLMSGTTYHHHPGINLIAGGFASMQDHHFCHRFFPMNQQQIIRAFDGNIASYDGSNLLFSQFQQSRAAEDHGR